jgi:hypothetical protein
MNTTFQPYRFRQDRAVPGPTVAHKMRQARYKIYFKTSRRGKRGLTAVIAVIGMGLIAGCGTTPATYHKPTPKPSASTSAKTSKGLTLAEASSASYKVSFPLVNCSTLSAAAQAAWAPIEIGSQINQCAPTDFLTQDVPQHVTVTNEDPSISQAKANAYGQALVNTSAWDTWAEYADAPALLTALGQNTGDNAPVYEALASGFRELGSMTGNSVYPNSITLVPLSSTDQTILGDTKVNFALVVTYVQKSYTDTGQFPGQAVKSATAPPATPGIYAGAIVATSVLGAYFQTSSSSENCSSGPSPGICQAAGAS